MAKAVDIDLGTVMGELRRHFRPEFLNRVDDVLLFKPVRVGVEGASWWSPTTTHRTPGRRPEVAMAEIVACPNCGKRNRVPAAAPGVARCANCHTALPWLTTAGDGDFEQVVTAATLPVLVDLWAPWCGPCRVVAPGVEQAARELAGRLRAVNVDQAPRTAKRFSVQGSRPCGPAPGRGGRPPGWSGPITRRCSAGPWR
jgi:thioredoxin 2